jgi:hypothetical protein
MKYKFIQILLFSVFFVTTGFSQESATTENVEKIEVPESHLEKYYADKDFDYTVVVKEENFIDRIYNWIVRKLKNFGMKLFEWIFGIKSAGEYFAYFIKILPYLAIVIFSYFLFRYLLGIDLIRLGKKKNIKFPMVDLSDEERIMKEEDLQKLIANAVADNNYRLATRYYYLSILKMLVERNVIDWRPEKTNRDYVSEVRTKQYASDFKNLTYVYDFVWYGNFNPNKQEFDEIASDFSQFNPS